MANPEFRTLAHSKSPKTTKRTTFQDELQAALSARASKTKPSSYSNYDDFEEDDDSDFLQTLVKLRKQRTVGLKSAKSKSKTSTFDLSDNESKENRTKKVSFLKTQKINPYSNDTTDSESYDIDRPKSSLSQHSFDSFCSNTSEGSTQLKESNTKRGTLLDLPLQSDGSVEEAPVPAEENISTLAPQLSTPNFNHTTSPGDVGVREPPKPKPRQRTLRLNLHVAEKSPEKTKFQDIGRPETASTSFSLSNDASSNSAVRSTSPQCANEENTVLSSNQSEHSQLITKSTVGSGSGDGFLSDDSKEQGRHCSTSFEDPNDLSGDQSDQLCCASEKSSQLKNSRTSSEASNRHHNVSFRKVESKYLGRFKVLDQKVLLQNSQPQAADSLRAAIYQEWLKKKRETSIEKVQMKRQEEIQKETKKREQETKKEDAILSYNAWKEKKTESLKAKALERQDLMRKEQRAAEEKEEKRQSAKQVFEKWKRERDRLLKEKYRKQKEAENKLQMRKQEKEEQRRQASTSAFSTWSEKKKVILHEKHVIQRKIVTTGVQEGHYVKEERERIALEMYENWLTRKNMEQKRQREERQIKAIINMDILLPPWSPPNKTIPYRK